MSDARFAVTVIGKDRPGIVASVTRSLYDNGCNLEDVTSTILRGHFSMTMIVTSAGSRAEDLESALRSNVVDELLISVRPLAEADAVVDAPTHMISVYGSDRPGIVAVVTEALAANGANITDLTSRIIGSDDEPVYALMLEVALADPSSVEARLGDLRDQLGVDISMHPIDTDIL